MKYEEIYNGTSGFNRGELRKYLIFLVKECSNMIEILDNDDKLGDVWGMSDCLNLLSHINDMTKAESIFGHDLARITDPQSKFIADKALRTFGREVMCDVIKQIKDDIRELEFEDYRAKNLHMEIYRAMQSLYEDYCKEYDAKE